MTKAIFCILLGGLFSVNSAQAQLDHGWWVDGLIGGTYNYSPTLNNALKSPNLVGGSVTVNGICVAKGGGVHFLTHDRLVISGNGVEFGISSSGRSGTINYKYGGGLVDVGYIMGKKKKMIAYPYIGAGGFGTKFQFVNTSGERVYIDPFPTFPHQNYVYSTGGLTFDAGYSAKFFLFNTDAKVKISKRTGIKSPKRCLGAVLGIDGGVSYNLAVGSWRNTYYRELLSSIQRGYSLDPYIRITLGFGKFATSRD